MTNRNIFLDYYNVIKLGDLGLAKLMKSTKASSVASSIAGTPAYMSPEQLSGAYSTPTDIWF